VVTFAGYYKGYGNLVKIRHENGDVTCYAHNSKLLVGVGDRVLQGQRIAEMGRTGIASANHCHFELRPKGGDPVDPEEYLPEGVLEVRLCD
jgi:murein DD-endopeptidase MepM/ murein hydrolase activator NlpD